MLLYAATGDGIARLEPGHGDWMVELSLQGSGARCLAWGPVLAETYQQSGSSGSTATDRV